MLVTNPSIASPAFLTVLGGAGFLYSWREVRRAAASPRWPTVQGQVVTSTVREYRPKPDSQTEYSARITYRYRVGSVDHEGSRIAFGGITFFGQSSAAAKAQEYRDGSAVTVYVSPDNPKLSVLEPGQTWTGLLTLIATAVATVVGVVWLFQTL